MVKIFIVVLNWNRPEDTLECLKSIRKLRIGNYDLKIVVIDNASKDDSIAQIGKFTFHDSRFMLIRNSKNLGFAEGNNVGIRYALKKGADWVLVLNNDTVVESNLVAEMLRVADSQPKIGAVCPKIYFARGFEFLKERYSKNQLGKVIWAAGGRIDWENIYGTNRGVDEVDIGQYNQAETVDFAPGTAVLLNVEALKAVGLFDKRYFMYLEDVDLSHRMKLAGWKAVYAPDATLWHKVGQSSAVGADLNDYFITRNRMLFGIVYAPLRSKLALIRESIRFLLSGRSWQRRGIIDYYLGRFGKGSWK